MKTLAILGAGGHGKVLADAALCSGWDAILFFDDKWPDIKRFGYWEVIGNSHCLLEKPYYDEAIVAIGNNAIRLQKINELQLADIPLTTIIHPHSSVSKNSCIGRGSAVFAGAVINIDAHLGRGCIVNTGASVDHDCLLADTVHLAPGVRLAGNVHIGTSSWLGIGCSVKQRIRIGKNVIVGAGAVVVNDICENTTVIGVPAKAFLKEE